MLRQWIVASNHLTCLVAEGVARLGSWTSSASYSLRATSFRLARLRSSVFGLSEAVMLSPRCSALEDRSVLVT